LKRWYNQQGYVLHTVTGATLRADSATAEIAVQEPIVSETPVAISFCKEMIVDPESGELLTLRQYRDKHTARRTFGFDSKKLSSLNVTYAPTDGRIKPNKIAQALDLEPGKPFGWNPQRWALVSTSRIFKRVLQASPQAQVDGTVQLHIIATEAPTRHLEYGVGKSLYTDSWEGELEFEHLNLLGGGETLGLTVRRGTKDIEPSVRVRFSDDKFGMSRGYEVEAFTNYIGDLLEEILPGDNTAPDYDKDPLLNRKGATFRLRNPMEQHIVTNSLLTASLEKIGTRTGLHESIANTGIGLGPFISDLPFDARQAAEVTVSVGSRYTDPTGAPDEEPLLASTRFKPYSTIMGSVKHIFPIMNTAGPNRRPLVLALKHSATTSTKHIPRHEAQALGVASNIRGSTPNGRVMTALRGTTEIRLPINLPRQVRQDATVVLYSEWLLACKGPSMPFFRKSAVGIGFRKTIQGIPLKYDISYSKDGKLKTAFGLGADFYV
jgi:hypothetical protein